MSFIFVLSKIQDMKTAIKIKSVYEPPLKKDGCRILVDRLWPRGVTKEEVAFDAWAKQLAPSTGLRKWYGHDPDLWEEFRKRYKLELQKNEAVVPFIETYKSNKMITLLFAAKDKAHVHALVLQEFLEKQFNK